MSRATVTAWSLFALATTLTVIGLILLALSRSVVVPPGWGVRGFTAIFAAVTSAIGLVVALRQPRNPIGWLFLAAAATWAIQLVAEEYAFYALLQRGGSLPGGEIGAWIQGWIWLIGVALTVVYVALLFPDGHLRSRRWRVVAWAGIGAIGAGAAFFALKPGPVSGLAALVDNPYGLRALEPISGALGFASILAMSIVFVASFASVFLRFRGARGVERQQLKWFAYASAVVAFALVLNTAVQIGAIAFMPMEEAILRQGDAIQKATQVFFIASITFVFVAVGLAIARYRLYDIDVIIKRTVVYGATSAAIAATFFLGIVALQAVLRPLTSGSDLPVAASTLVSFGLFAPIRARVQAAVDRRFDRARYDAARTVDLFADRLRDEIDLDALRSELLRAVGQTMAPSHTSLWLRRSAQ